MIVYIALIPMLILYNIGIEAFLYDHYNIPPSTTFLGGPEPCTADPSERRIVPNVGRKAEEKKRIFILSIELLIYYLIHIFLTFIPFYCTIIALSRMIVCIVEMCRTSIAQANVYYDLAMRVLTQLMTFFRIGNYIIDKINYCARGLFRIRKSAESLTTYSLATVCIIGISLFYLCKKFFTKKDPDHPQPHTRNAETRGQAMVNLGIMIIAFIGWSDFGLWKKFQDWIRATEYVNKVFGDSATDRTCRNYDPNKYNPTCRGATRGPHLCLGCSAAKVAKEPAILSRVVLDYSINSVMEDPALYFYPLANSIVKNYDKDLKERIPLWYTRLPSFLQEQIFESHYASIANVDTFPKRFRLNHMRLMKGDFLIQRDENLKKWTIVTTEADIINKKMYETPSNKPTKITSFDNQYIITESDSDSEDYQAARKPKVYYENMDTKIATSAVPHTRNAMEREKALDDLEHYYADAFMFDDDEKKDACEAIPLLQHLPAYFKPCIFIAAMCLVLYGSFHYYRKYKQNQVISAKIEDKVSTIIAESVVKSQQELPPVLRTTDGILDVNPETKPISVTVLNPLPQEQFHRDEFLNPETWQSNMKDKSRKTERYQPHHYRKHEEDTSDFKLQPKQSAYHQIKKNKQRAYIVYNLDDLDKLLKTGGVFMVDKDNRGKTVTTREEYEALKLLGYQASTEDLMKIKRAALDLTDTEEPGKIDFNIFKQVVNLESVTVRGYHYLTDLLDAGLKPDDKWMKMFGRYNYDPDLKKYSPHYTQKEFGDAESNPLQAVGEITVPTPPIQVQLDNMSQAKQIMKRQIDEIKQQDEILSKPSTVTMEDYIKYRDFLDKYVDVLSNPKLAVVLQNKLKDTVIAEPESNVSTIHSNDCPYGSSCGLKGNSCFLNHPFEPKPESMCGHIKVNHYPNNMNTKNAYQIFQKGIAGNHHAMCTYTKLGFITNYHTFFEDNTTRLRPIPPNELEVMVEGKRYTIISYERFPNILGAEGKQLPEIFQDMVVFKIAENLNITPAKAKPPRNGEKVCIISANQLTYDEYEKRDPKDLTTIKTYETELEVQPNGMYCFKSNHTHGDSGSGVYSLEQNFALVGVYFGRAARDLNGMIPIDGLYVPNINAGIPFSQTKNIRPTA